MRFEFGIKARDIITGFDGVVIGYCCYITGCDQYLLAPKVGKDKSRTESCWVDEDRLEQMGISQIKLPSNNSLGGDLPAPIK